MLCRLYFSTQEEPIGTGCHLGVTQRQLEFRRVGIGLERQPIDLHIGWTVNDSHWQVALEFAVPCKLERDRQLRASARFETYPCFVAIVISLTSLPNNLPLLASFALFRCLIFAHLLCPAMTLLRYNQYLTKWLPSVAKKHSVKPPITPDLRLII